MTPRAVAVFSALVREADRWTDAGLHWPGVDTGGAVAEPDVTERAAA
jgi:hypothetical protein